MTELEHAFWAIVFASYSCEEQEALWLMADTGFRLIAEQRARA